MRKEYGYAVAVSTESGRKIADSKKREFGVIVSRTQKRDLGHPDIDLF
jgi:hypothetical protein